MSEIERFDSSAIMWSLDGAPLRPSKDGPWVRYADVAALAHPQQAAPMLGVKVKALEWFAENPSIFSADDYIITDFQGVAGQPVPGMRYELRRSSGVSSKLHFKTLEAAKAAAQADYEQRILSALATPEAGTSEREPVARADILREWFGGKRYARDYEYLDASYGAAADRVLAYLNSTHPAPVQAPVDGEAVRALMDFEPQISFGAFGPERSVRWILEWFYKTNGIDAKKAKHATDSYIEALCEVAAAPSARKEP